MARMGEEATDGHRLDTGSYLARVRRIADLSQRELADEVRVGQATIARWESGGLSITVAMLDRILRLAGLRLAVVDQHGRPVQPLDPDAVRDNAGRRFPAHLDVVPPERMPLNRGAGRRYDRPEPQGWYALRATRERAIASGTERPAEHPTVSELASLHSARRAAPGFLRPAAGDLPDCTCADDCWERSTCTSGCSCQCEPPRSGL